MLRVYWGWGPHCPLSRADVSKWSCLILRFLWIKWNLLTWNATLENKKLPIPRLNLRPHKEGTGYAGQKLASLEISDPTFPWPQLSHATAVHTTLPRKSKALSAAVPKPSTRSWFQAFFQVADISHGFFWLVCSSSATWAWNLQPIVEIHHHVHQTVPQQASPRLGEIKKIQEGWATRTGLCAGETSAIVAMPTQVPEDHGKGPSFHRRNPCQTPSGKLHQDSHRNSWMMKNVEHVVLWPAGELQWIYSQTKGSQGAAKEKMGQVQGIMHHCCLSSWIAWSPWPSPGLCQEVRKVYLPHQLSKAINGIVAKILSWKF